jgi:hypothetical protein
MSKSRWYQQGQDDCADGFCDPPMNPGHRDHTKYMEGWNDQDAEEKRILHDAEDRG